MKLKHLKLKISNYKCFDDQAQGFDEIAPLNLIVGRNNSGKSALLDLIALACNFDEPPTALRRSGKKPFLIINAPISEALLRKPFPAQEKPIAPLFGAGLPVNHKQQSTYEANKIKYERAQAVWSAVAPHVDKRATFTLGARNAFNVADAEVNSDWPDDVRQQLSVLSLPDILPLTGKRFFRLNADRDVIPENDNNLLKISSNGQGLTNTIQRILNQEDQPHHLVDEKLLEGLNEIFSPDARFDGISTRQSGSIWQIFLREKQKGLIPLSNSGSGLKTVLLVLAALILLPYVENKSLAQFVFAFEELENNLHPALQRRLVNFVRQKCLDNGCTAFFTTHSSAIIDLLGNDKEAQILHVTNTGERATVQRVTSYVHSKGVLDDLDIRASDLLQSNGVVWVEGPSDRLYFNKWIELIARGQLTEGAHYQCVFYGGRLLAHLKGTAPFDNTTAEQAVKIFGINRNAIALMDSDITAEGASINTTKSRIVAELSEHDGMAWVTTGKEIENYLSSDLLNKLHNGLQSAPQFGDFADHLDAYRGGLGRAFERKKVLFAESAVELMTQGDLEVLDLRAKMVEAASRIASWNGITLSEEAS